MLKSNKIKRHITVLVHWSCIQADSGGICTALGNDGMRGSKQKRSYEIGSDFERLWRYAHFLITLDALM